uniref:Uncharacterized protein n=1 Tax=Ciona intestinalis TaxID=7719 RepID=F6UMR8_CIOIN
MTANVKQSHPTSLPNHEFIPKPPDFPPNPHEPPKYAISSPESPLFSPGSESPCIAPQMTAFDDASSGTDEMCDPISIRIPVDDHGRVNDTNQNTELEVTGSKMELDVTLTQDNQDAVNDKQANNTEPTIDSVSDASNSAVDETAEGRRRSARIMTKMQKRKSRWSSRPQGVDSPTPEVQNKTENMDLLFDKQQQQQQQQQEEEEDKVKTVGENALSNTASPSFEAISDNIYLCEKKKSRVRKEIRRMVCECDNNEDGTPCGSDCLNRLLMIECSARCPLGEQCQNKRFQRKQYVPTEVFQTKWKGWGIRATENLSPGMLVMEYCGEVLDLQEFGRRSLLYSRGNQQHFYFMALSQDEIIDATTKGNTSRFINHSCDPNCETQKWTVNGRLRVGFFTMRDINKGEEITFDYQFQRYGKEAQACYCGSSNCRGYLGKAPDEDDDVIADDVMANDVTCVDDVSKFEDNSAVITSVATETG